MGGKTRSRDKTKLRWCLSPPDQQSTDKSNYKSKSYDETETILLTRVSSCKNLYFPISIFWAFGLFSGRGAKSQTISSKVWPRNLVPRWPSLLLFKCRNQFYRIYLKWMVMVMCIYFVLSFSSNRTWDIIQVLLKIEVAVPSTVLLWRVSKKTKLAVFNWSSFFRSSNS